MSQDRSRGRVAVTRAIAVILSVLLAAPLEAPSLRAQTAPADAAGDFSTDQIAALLAPIALYPDPLLTQILMASTEPSEVGQAGQWLQDPTHAGLTGDALTAALEAQDWDPSVKSLVPFPSVLEMMNARPAWVQQLGYAFAAQQADVLDAVQRLRQQAQAAGHLQSSPQQVVATQANAITIQPADPQLVYVPAYNPTQVFGAWPYPATPPVFLPRPAGYAVGPALATGLAFGAGIAITAGLWNLARPNWGWRGTGYGGVTVNVDRWNHASAGRPGVRDDAWRPPPGGRPGGWNPGHPPGGPVGPGRRADTSPGAPGGGEQRPGGDNRPERPGAGGSGEQHPGGDNRPNRPGARGSGEQHPGGQPHGGSSPDRSGSQGHQGGHGDVHRPSGHSGGGHPAGHSGGHGGGEHRR